MDAPSAVWTPSSWTQKPIKQDVTYADQTAFHAVLQKLERLPPLVTPQEINRLKSSLRDVALGKAFVLHGGDCAELFDYCEQSKIESKVKLLLQMSLVLIWGSNKPVYRIGRIAGQFAKPRSSPMETVDGVVMPSFRGDNVNGYEATPESREPNPDRLLSAYFHSAATLNYLRGALGSGLADLHSPMDWGLVHVKDQTIKDKYRRIVDRITDSLRFLKTIGADNSSGVLETVDIYTSHEGLMLEYEQALTRLLRHPAYNPPQPSSSQSTSSYYSTSGHFLWIGDRTRQLTGAHIEFFRGIANPIGLKVGPSLPPSELISLLDVLNPNHEIGKVTLITRYGAEKIATYLPAHIRAVQGTKHIPIWQCDPMHGNTVSTPSGIKTRTFDSIFSELRSALEIHRQENSYLGGVHLELTGEAVTECTGGSGGLTEEGLSERYETYCDPRLNEKQALELAFLVAEFYRGERGD